MNATSSADGDMSIRSPERASPEVPQLVSIQLLTVWQVIVAAQMQVRDLYKPGKSIQLCVWDVSSQHTYTMQCHPR